MVASTMPTSTVGTMAARERFELSMYGEGVERRYRKMRPEVEKMPWGTFDHGHLSARALNDARISWTGAAFQEHRTGLACAMALRGMIEARVPLDLIALSTRFPLDEMVHVELAARMAMELGGAADLRHDPDLMIVEPPEGLPPLTRAADMVVRFFCVGEALSIPLLRGTWKAAVQPLPKAILGRIVKDEAAHGQFGFTFLDWAVTRMDAEAIAAVGRAADRGIGSVVDSWAKSRANRPADFDASGDTLGWMRSDAYYAAAERAMEEKVRAPLRERGIPITA
jgi:hypothetical protein